MPWKELTVEAQRQSLCYRIVHQRQPLAQVCREAGISRKTAYKWLKRYRTDPHEPLADRSRRPVNSPGRTAAEMEQKVLAVRDEHRWGGRKIYSVLKNAGDPICSIRTVSAILKRCGRTRQALPKPQQEPPVFFERSGPNELWQLDHQGPREIERKRHRALTVVDDHSRFCFCYEPLLNTSIQLYWPVLWRVFKEFGLPESILCDNAFSAHLGISELEMRLIRLGIRPIHGRSYHPQTQGKVERLHGSIDYELIDFKARCQQMDLFREDRDRWLRTYNYLRPHESLGDHPPISRFVQSPRRCPENLPAVEYDQGQTLRKVSQVGDINYKRVRIGLSRSLSGQYVRIEERQETIGVFYAWKELRTLTHEQLRGRRQNQWT